MTSLTAAAVRAAGADAATWTGHDTQLILAILIGIAVIVVLVTVAKMHPFLALTLGSLALGLVAQLPLDDLLGAFTKGFGDTAGGVGVLIALGAMLGKLLADSGGADQIVDTIVGRAGRRGLPWAMALVAALIGLPMFFEIGLVMLVPVILLVAKRTGTQVLRVGIPALAGLSVLHGLVPPHPGPLVAISTLHVQLGLTLGLGLLVAIPTVIIAGPLFGNFVSRWVTADPPADLVPQEASATGAGDTTGPGAATAPGTAPATRRPSFAVTLTTVLLPVVLMLLKAVGTIAFSKGTVPYTVLNFVGDPLIALLIGVLVAMFTLGRPAGFTRDRLSTAIGESLKPIVGIFLIVAGGGGFGEVLAETGVGDVIKQLATSAHLSPLLLGWLVAVVIRVATGSATVATISAASIVAPLVAGLDPVHGALLALAVGAGSLIFSHVNDGGFWLVKEYFGMKVGQTIKTWSVMETIISVVALLFVLLLGWLF